MIAGTELTTRQFWGSYCTTLLRMIVRSLSSVNFWNLSQRQSRRDRKRSVVDKLCLNFELRTNILPTSKKLPTDPFQNEAHLCLSTIVSDSTKLPKYNCSTTWLCSRLNSTQAAARLSKIRPLAQEIIPSIWIFTRHHQIGQALKATLSHLKPVLKSVEQIL